MKISMFGSLALTVVVLVTSTFDGDTFAAPHDTGTRATYLVTLTDPALVTDALHRIGAQGVAGTQAKEHLAVRAELTSAHSTQYLHDLDSARARMLGAAAAQLGRALEPSQVYRYATNGVAVELSADEATRLASLPGVVSVRRERTEHVQTDAGPQWIGADAVWAGSIAGTSATKGESIVVGIVDTGINPTHPSFAATGGDGYTHNNPRGKFYGLCASGQATCNAKLIGMYDFTSEHTKGVDSVGHGSHVSGIAVGNAITSQILGTSVSLPRNVSGVAPHANLIMYKACVAATAAQPDGGCPESSLVAAIDQAIADGVDVINFSIGGDASDPFALLSDHSSDAFAFLQARAAGIVSAVAAGNDGPGVGSLEQPGNVPWVIGVANASHNRRFVNSIGDFSGVANPPPTLVGQGYTPGYGPASIVYAGNYGSALCGTGASEGATPTGASNPFPAGTFHGEIVICDRGTYGRVEKGFNVKAAGAGGMVLANANSDGESTVSDTHYLPTVHLGYDEGSQIKNFASSGFNYRGTISGVSAVLSNSFGDILDASSGRGPVGYAGGILKPDITAPGANILSSVQTGAGLALLTGTSMASPHVAGAVALVRAVHRDWSPSQVESALLGTALANSVRREDAVTPATPLDAGAGRVQPAGAVQAGIYLPMSNADIAAASPVQGGDPRNLNRPGIEDEHCLSQCSFVRTVTDMSGGGSWQVSVTATPGAIITVTPSQFTLGAGASQKLNIVADVSDAHLPGSWVSARILLHKAAGGTTAVDSALTLAVYSSAGATPAFQEIIATHGAGSTKLNLNGLVALPHATFSTTSLRAAQVTSLSLPEDPGTGDLYTFPGTGKQVVTFSRLNETGPPPTQPLNVKGRVFVVEITASDAGQVTLYAGVNASTGDQPEQSEQLCSSISSNGSVARCVIDLANAGFDPVSGWALVDVTRGGGAVGQTYSIQVSGGIANVIEGEDASNGVLVATGPGHVPAATDFSVQLAYGGVDFSNQITPGRYYGAVLVDGIAGLNGQSAMVPFALTRGADGDDPTDALQPGYFDDAVLTPSASRTLTLAPGQSLQHMFMDVSGSLNPESLIISTALIFGAAQNVSFYAVQTPFPASSTLARPAAAPSATGAAMQWSLDATTSNKTVTIPISSSTVGRWYVVATNTGSSTAFVQLVAGVQFTAGFGGAPFAPGPGVYYNPQRSGHGIFVSESAGQQVVSWYTYHEDGTPAWYFAQGAQAGSGRPWVAPMYRPSWDGSAHSITQVGDMILTPVSATQMILSWHLYGDSGSETVTQLGAGSCPQLNGASTNLNGLWYAPAQSGYGMDVLALPDQNYVQFYFYDSLGQPLWGVGAATPFASTTSLNMTQKSGFCPTCAYTPISSQALGTLSVNYSNATNGTYSTNFTLQPPLSGSWNVNQPIARLTGDPTDCKP